jgi:cellulose synthase/poly-beta-1,6-N-acetylglucosamine synthase-like glycosyltransferase
MILILLASGLLSLYAILIGLITIGWFRAPIFQLSAAPLNTKVSIIVAVRNEKQNILQLLTDLSGQDYPSELIEIIMVDDHSDDLTTLKIREFMDIDEQQTTVKLLELKEESVSGKKAAIDFGIQYSTGDLILTTDADCRLPMSWVTTIVGFHENMLMNMILAPVRFKPGPGFFGKLQELEFMSLQATTAGSAEMGFPLLANGANLAYTKDAYKSCKGFSGNSVYPSGDDVFMMSAIKKQYGMRSVSFLKSQETIVTTLPETNLKGFINQRLRWVSKSRGVKDAAIMMSSLLVYLTNLAFVISLICACIQLTTYQFVLLFYLIKLLVDLPVMIGISRFMNRLKLMWFFPVMEIINAIYVVIIGLIGNVMSFNWKGRHFN